LELDAALDRFIRKPHENQQKMDSVETYDVTDSADNAQSVDVSEADTMQDLLINIKKAFLKDAAKAILTISGEIKKGMSTCDLKLLDITFHGLKSAAANIGETELSEAAKALEFAAKDKRVEELFAQTESFLNQLEATIRKCQEAMPDAQKPAGDLLTLQESAKRIANACEEYDTDAAKAILTQLEQYAWDVEIEVWLTEISEKLLHSDFEEAEKLAKKTNL
jgi:HPt (histidine-containing phosphotransfer) domain-containing protein